MNKQILDRVEAVKALPRKVPLPILIPALAAILIAAVSIGFSQVLLSLEKEAATAIALVAAVNIMGIGAFVAVRPRVTKAAIVELLAIIAIPIGIGVGIATLGAEATEPPDGGVAPVESSPVAEPLEVSAQDLAFDTSELVLTADAPVVIQFTNADLAPHNIAIYEDEAAGRAMSGAIFDGPDVAAGGSATYEFDAPTAGTYYFQCDLHPDMNGTVSVE